MDGNPAYYHPRLKILQTTNPILDKFAAMSTGADGGALQQWSRFILRIHVRILRRYQTIKIANKSAFPPPSLTRARFKRQKAYTTAMQRGPAPKTNIATRLSVRAGFSAIRTDRCDLDTSAPPFPTAPALPSSSPFPPR